MKIYVLQTLIFIAFVNISFAITLQLLILDEETKSPLQDVSIRGIFKNTNKNKKSRLLKESILNGNTYHNGIFIIQVNELQTNQGRIEVILSKEGYQHRYIKERVKKSKNDTLIVLNYFMKTKEYSTIKNSLLLIERNEVINNRNQNYHSRKNIISTTFGLILGSGSTADFFDNAFFSAGYTIGLEYSRKFSARSQHRISIGYDYSEIAKSGFYSANAETVKHSFNLFFHQRINDKIENLNYYAGVHLGLDSEKSKWEDIEYSPQDTLKGIDIVNNLVIGLNLKLDYNINPYLILALGFTTDFNIPYFTRREEEYYSNPEINKIGLNYNSGISFDLYLGLSYLF